MVIPKTKAQEDFLRYISMIAGVSYQAKFILDHGRFWTPAALPLGVRRGQKGYCYCNAQSLVCAREDEFTYVEGYAMSVIPLMHGWAVDELGNVVDPTWDPKEEGIYFGVAFKSRYIESTSLESGYWWSLIDNHHNRFRLVRGEENLLDVLA